MLLDGHKSVGRSRVSQQKGLKTMTNLVHHPIYGYGHLLMVDTTIYSEPLAIVRVSDGWLAKSWWTEWTRVL